MCLKISIGEAFPAVEERQVLGLSGFGKSKGFTGMVNQISLLGSGQGCPLRMMRKPDTWFSLKLTSRSNGIWGLCISVLVIGLLGHSAPALAFWSSLNHWSSCHYVSLISRLVIINGIDDFERTDETDETRTVIRNRGKGICLAGLRVPERTRAVLLL